MELEYDESKSRANLAKHGIDFAVAQALWQDSRRVEIPARAADESRDLVIASLDGRLWSAVVTEREGRTRIISVRRSRNEERRIYEG